MLCQHHVVMTNPKYFLLSLGVLRETDRTNDRDDIVCNGTLFNIWDPRGDDI